MFKKPGYTTNDIIQCLDQSNCFLDARQFINDEKFKKYSDKEAYDISRKAILTNMLEAKKKELADKRKNNL